MIDESWREKELNIIRFIENYGMITVKQCAKIFYQNRQHAYVQAARRLAALHKNRILKRTTAYPCKQFVYYLDKKPRYHMQLLFDVYAELAANKAEIELFKVEPKYLERKINPDGLIVYRYNNHKYAMFIEIDWTHEPENERYYTLYNTGIIQNTLGGFPMVVRVTNKKRNDIYSDKENKIDIIYVDLDLNNFKDKVL